MVTKSDIAARGVRRKPKPLRTPKQKARRLIADILSNYYESEWFDDYDGDERDGIMQAYDEIHDKLSEGRAG